MPTLPDEDLETFLRRQDAGDLVSVLLELAKDHEAVQERLARMQLADRPDKLAAWLESQLSEALDASSREESPPIDVFRISGALSLLAESLRDPDIMVRALLRYSPNPNPVHQQTFARAYLDADRPADGMLWLQDAWGHLDDSRQDLLADASERLGRFEESAPIRQRIFERTLSDFHCQR